MARNPAADFMMRWKVWLACLAAALSFAGAARAVEAAGSASKSQADFDGRVRPILAQYCMGCHGPRKKKGDLDLSKSDNAKFAAHKELWQNVATRLSAGEMPPEKKPQPTDAERKLIVAWVQSTVGLATIDCSKIASDDTQRYYRGYVMSRRLNRTEYNNTIRDLVGLDLRPGDDLPEDGAGGEGFDTDGDALFVSSILIEKYLSAARKTLETALPDGADSGVPRGPAARLLVARADAGADPRIAARADVAEFARRAWRRPVTGAEVDRLLGLFDHARRRGEGFVPALRLAMEGALISPNFLFLVEPEGEHDGVYPLGDFPLASRLSYFLWSSMPDEELFKLAAEHRLNEPETLKREVGRMLKDPRAKALGENFGEQWLGVTALGITIRPDNKRFPKFNDALAADMRQESAMFVNSVLLDDRSLLDLLTADYTFLNSRLADCYGIAGVQGSELHKVHLDNRDRGGVLGLGAVLTCTSYPLRTSPVLRGKWVLEQLLGEHVPPPPANAGKLPQDDHQKDGLTFRQRLEKHRSNPDCAGCHSRMDPIGFGLENFDPMGRWRDKEADAPVDAAGQLPSGEKFTGPAELRQILLKRKDEFLRNFSRKMLGYALGRGLNRFDNCVIDDALKALAAHDDRPSVLIEQIVLSAPFRYRYAKR